ncbi:hypothetical protein ERHA55_28030 [Erwinia rhapontici]|nr:hypothetical protein ERHA55_28030 [Erwinia rhapontici]
MAQKRQFALLGTGFIGQVHAKNLAAHPDSELVMVADQDSARADEIATRYGAGWAACWTLSTAMR